MRMMTALITNRNKPKVNIVMGMVKRMSMGLTTTLETEINTATKRAAQ